METTITLSSEIVTDPEERIEFLPGLATPRYMMAIERACFNMALDFIADDYDGGFWQYVQISDQDGNQVAGFLYPDLDQEVTFSSMNGAVEKMSARHAGLCITLTALSHLSFHIYEREGMDSAAGQRVAEQYHALRNWMFEGEFDDNNPADRERIQPLVRVLD
jgi:hypothetical protein